MPNDTILRPLRLLILPIWVGHHIPLSAFRYAIVPMVSYWYDDIDDSIVIPGR
jgi:hypothetical protein